MAKSLLSPVGALEFAKRFITRFGNCSPISIGEILVSDRNFACLANLPRKRKIRLADLFSIMGYKFKTIGSLEKSFSNLPKKARNMMIVSLSPWGTYPSSSLFEWIHLDGLNRVSKKERKDLGLNILILIDKLRTKITKLQPVFNSVFRMSGVGGGPLIEELTRKVRDGDPNSFDLLMNMVIEPQRHETHSSSLRILRKVTDLQNRISQVVFNSTDLEINQFWIEYVDLENEFNQISNESAFTQAVSKPFVEPSPRNIVKLYNSLRGPTNLSYVSEAPLSS